MDTITHDFRGLRPTDPGGRCGLRNPGRGFRIETVIAEPAGKDNPNSQIPGHLRGRIGPGFNRMNWIMDARRFEAHGLTLAQTYCYLTEYHDREIAREKFDLLEDAFRTLRHLGLKCVLRFAYVTDDPKLAPPPPLDRILQHIEQLRPFLRKHHDVIHTLEAGFVAAWGEWHMERHLRTPKERTILLRAILDMVPRSIHLQIRYPGMKHDLVPRLTGEPYRPVTADTAFGPTPEARIGYNDDGVLTYPENESTYRFAREPEEYGNLQKLVQQETLFVPMGGELFWSDMAWYDEGTHYKTFDGLEAAEYLRDYHFNVFSLAHSYSEREGSPRSIDHWLSRPVTQTDLRTRHLPVSEDWFKDNFGRPVERSQFEYIRDHLGYRLELQQLRIPVRWTVRQPFSIELTLINLGFSTLFTHHPVFFTLIDIHGKITLLPVENADPRHWIPHRPGDTGHSPLTHTLGLKDSLPDAVAPGRYMLGLWIPDPCARLQLRSEYAVRVANGDVPFWRDEHHRYGINLLHTVHVHDD